MNALIRLSLALSLVPSSVAFARGGDPAAGKQKAAQCLACHGANGISNNSQWPNLAGQKNEYIEAQLKAFHDGQRVNQMMNGVAKMLSNTDMQDLAAYFSQLKAL